MFLSFVRSGYVNLNAGQPWNVGVRGYGWSRVALHATGAYYLNVGPTDVYPSGTLNRWYGFPLRCLYYGSV